MLSVMLPFHRVTSTPRARLSSLSQLLDLVCAFRCVRHDHRATVEHVSDGRIGYAACCEDLLDLVERSLTLPSRDVRALVAGTAALQDRT